MQVPQMRGTYVTAFLLFYIHLVPVINALGGIKSVLACSSLCQATKDCVDYYYVKANGTCILGDTVALTPSRQTPLAEATRDQMLMENHVVVRANGEDFLYTF